MGEKEKSSIQRADVAEEKFEVDIVSLAQAEVKDGAFTKIKLGQLWQKQTTIFVFLRNFACIACRTHAKQVWDKREVYEKKGSRIVFIGNGEPEFIEVFKQEVGIEDAPIYTDPSLESFRASGFKRGFLAALGPRALKNGFSFNRHGHKQGKYESGSGDLWQLGGILVINKEGRVLYQHISQVLGDFPPEKDVPKNDSIWND